MRQSMTRKVRAASMLRGCGRDLGHREVDVFDLAVDERNLIVEAVIRDDLSASNAREDTVCVNACARCLAAILLRSPAAVLPRALRAAGLIRVCSNRGDRVKRGEGRVEREDSRDVRGGAACGRDKQLTGQCG
jgi:hypothetical protein